MSATIDQIVTNALEKGLAGDQNDQTTIIGRHVAEIVETLTKEAGFPARRSGVTETSADFLQLDTNRVVGFDISAIDNVARTITVDAGVLFARSNAVATGALDSTHRIGLSLAQQVINVPAAAGSTIYYLLQAEVTEVVQQESRDVLVDPLTNTFSNQSVDKRRLHQVTLTTVTGTVDNIPDPTTHGAPLYAFEVEAGSGDVLIRDVIDLRTAPSDVLGPRTASTGAGRTTAYVSSHAFEVRDSNNLGKFSLAANIDGFSAIAYTFDDQPINLFPLLSPTDATPVAQRWYYLYAFRSPIGTTSARFAHAYGNVGTFSTLASNCGLVISAVKPRVQDRVNSGAIVLPRPLLNRNLAADQGVCVAALRLTGSTFSLMRVGTGGACVIEPITVTADIGGQTGASAVIAIASEANASLAGEDWFPLSIARRLRMSVRVSAFAAPVVTAGLVRVSLFDSLVGEFATGLIDPSILNDEVTGDVPTFAPGGNIRIGLTSLGVDGQPSGLVENTIGNTQFAVSVRGFDL